MNKIKVSVKGASHNAKHLLTESQEAGIAIPIIQMWILSSERLSGLLKVA